VLLYTVLAAALVATAYGSEDAIVLTEDNFDSVVDGSKDVFVKFYAPWCGHCKALAPTWEQIAAAYGRHKDKVVVAKIDCDSHGSVCSKYGVTGYPTLKYFKHGAKEPAPYSGGRTAEDLITFINGESGVKVRAPGQSPSQVVELTEDNFDKIVLDKSKSVLVEFFAPWCGHCKTLAPVYEKLGAAFANERNVVVAKLDADKHRAVGSKYGVTGFPTLIWFPKGDDKTESVNYNGGRDLESMVEWINRHADTYRKPDGSLEKKAGLLKSFESIVSDFLAGSKDKAVAAAKKAIEILEAGLPVRLGKFYLRAMEKLISGDKDFIEAEIERTQRLLDSGNVAADKRDEFSMRINILSLFAPDSGDDAAAE